MADYSRPPTPEEVEADKKRARGQKAGYRQDVHQFMLFNLRVCPHCSAVVLDWEQHEIWHEIMGC